MYLLKDTIYKQVVYFFFKLFTKKIITNSVLIFVGLI